MEVSSRIYSREPITKGTVVSLMPSALISSETPVPALLATWKQAGLPIGKPGFYDHPHYVRAEQASPGYISTYARYVRDRLYDPDYLVRSRAVVRTASAVLYQELVQDGRPNLCVAASKVLSKMLECEGIWNYIVSGAFSVSFSIGGQRHTRHFFPFDVCPVDAAHAWVVAPPFRIIDLTLRQQQYPGPARLYLPLHVLTPRSDPGRVAAHELCAPVLLRGLRRKGLGDDQILDCVLAKCKQVSTAFPPEVVRTTSATLKYVPIRIITPEGDLEHLRHLTVNGKTPEALYAQLQSRLRD